MSNEREFRIVYDGYRGKHLFYAFLGGAAAGAITALLTAPASGKETRAKLRVGRERGRDQVRHLPEAIKAATLAAEEAFLAALKDANHSHSDDALASSSKRRSPSRE